MNVAEWAETNWTLPETGNAIVLRPWQKAVLLAMFPASERTSVGPASGTNSAWKTFLISTVKKAGRSSRRWKREQERERKRKRHHRDCPHRSTIGDHSP